MKALISFAGSVVSAYIFALWVQALGFGLVGIIFIGSVISFSIAFIIEFIFLRPKHGALQSSVRMLAWTLSCLIIFSSHWVVFNVSYKGNSNIIYIIFRVLWDLLFNAPFVAILCFAFFLFQTLIDYCSIKKM